MRTLIRGLALAAFVSLATPAFPCVSVDKFLADKPSDIAVTILSPDQRKAANEVLEAMTGRGGFGVIIVGEYQDRLGVFVGEATDICEGIILAGPAAKAFKAAVLGRDA